MSLELPLDFTRLNSLRQYLQQMSEKHVPSIRSYYDSSSLYKHKTDRVCGFYHRKSDIEKDEKYLSQVSTAFCVSALLAAGQYDADLAPWKPSALAIAKGLLHSKWTSAGLDNNNIFTVAFVLEATTLLLADPFSSKAESEAFLKDKSNFDLITKAEKILHRSIEKGFAQLEEYPECAYMTQLVVRTLMRRESAFPNSKIAEKVTIWAWSQINLELALLSAKSKSADLFQLLYATILAATLQSPSNMTPDKNLLLQASLGAFFAGQLPDNSGTWPRSRPLFHYPEAGTAFCYEYEALVQLLNTAALQSRLLPYLDKLETAARALELMQFQDSAKVTGWSSGHRPIWGGPESWSTASAFHYLYALDRLVAEGIRQSVFEYLGVAYSPPLRPLTDPKKFAPKDKFLDCPLIVDGGGSLREYLLESFVIPLSMSARKIEMGKSLGKDTPIAAIFFGPPGTSKTELTKYISEYLQWPRLSIDPSHFVRLGMDQVQSEADKIFRMLAVTERVVVLFDEFDELVRDRSNSVEVLSRFLTTAMLPKLSAISSNRRLAFIVATNHIENFDLAISRPGRFDRVIQVLPPKIEAKLEKWDDLKVHLEGTLKISIQDEDAPSSDGAKQVAIKASDLTYDEFKFLQAALMHITARSEAVARIKDALGKCTMSSLMNPMEEDASKKKPWKTACNDQQERVRAAVFFNSTPP